MAKRLDPKTEVQVFLAVKQAGEATREELIRQIKSQWKIDVSEADLIRYLFKHKARKVITIRSRGGEEVWAVAGIPPWYLSHMMDLLEKATPDEVRDELKIMDERLKDDIKPYIGIVPKWRDFHSYNITFEAVDPILGGRPTNEDRVLQFPRRGDRLFIPASWFYGWIRDNQGLVDSVGLQYHVFLSSGEFDGEEVKTFKPTLKVKTGLTKFEGIPVGTRFKVTFRLPFKGGKMRSEGDYRQFFDMLAVAPCKGTGAYARAYGGRIKIVEMTEIKAA